MTEQHFIGFLMGITLGLMTAMFVYIKMWNVIEKFKSSLRNEILKRIDAEKLADEALFEKERLQNKLELKEHLERESKRETYEEQ